MAEVLARLVNEEQGLIMLLAPPLLDKSDLNPGYIKGYPPGEGKRRPVYPCRLLGHSGHGPFGRGDAAGNLLQLINPVNHSRTHKECFTYKNRTLCAGCRCLYGCAPQRPGGGHGIPAPPVWLFRVCVQNIFRPAAPRERCWSSSPAYPGNGREYTLQQRWGNGSPLPHSCPQSPRRLHWVRELRLTAAVWSAFPLQDDGKEHRVEVILRR